MSSVPDPAPRCRRSRASTTASATAAAKRRLPRSDHARRIIGPTIIPPKAIPPTVRTVGRSALITRPLVSTAEKVAPVGELHPSVSRRSTNPEPRLRSGPVELVVGEPGDGFGTGPGVNPESAQVPVAALSLEHHRRRSTLSQMRQRRVAQLVQSPPTGVTAEQGSRGAVGEPGLAGRGIEVTPGGGDCGSGRW